MLMCLNGNIMCSLWLEHDIPDNGATKPAVGTGPSILCVNAVEKFPKSTEETETFHSWIFH